MPLGERTFTSQAPPGSTKSLGRESRGDGEMAKVRITVKASGIDVQGDGYAGPRCESAVKYVSDLLNSTIIEEQHTQEYFQTPDQEVQQ